MKCMAEFFENKTMRNMLGTNSQELETRRVCVFVWVFVMCGCFGNMYTVL
jgi:hypothetical protein